MYISSRLKDSKRWKFRTPQQAASDLSNEGFRTGSFKSFTNSEGYVTTIVGVLVCLIEGILWCIANSRTSSFLVGSIVSYYSKASQYSKFDFFLLSTTTISDCLHNLGFTRDFRVAGNANGSLVNELWWFSDWDPHGVPQKAALNRCVNFTGNSSEETHTEEPGPRFQDFPGDSQEDSHQVQDFKIFEEMKWFTRDSSERSFKQFTREWGVHDKRISRDSIMKYVFVGPVKPDKNEWQRINLNTASWLVFEI